MLYLNSYISEEEFPGSVKGHFIQFEDLKIKSKADRRAFLQSRVTRLCKEGIDCSVVPQELMGKFHIAILWAKNIDREALRLKFSYLTPKIVSDKSMNKNLIKHAWQNRIRTYLIEKGLLKTGDRYVLKEEMDKKKIFKKAFRIQAAFLNAHPALSIDPCSRIMIPLTDKDIDRADAMGKDSEVSVRTLPHWSAGTLIGRSGKKASERKYKVGKRKYPTPAYWRIRNDIHFVKPSDEMLEVSYSLSEDTWEYPRSCVFKAFKRGMSLPSTLKKRPETRVKSTREFIDKYTRGLKFLGRQVSLIGPTQASKLGYDEHYFPSEKEFTVLVGNQNKTNINGLHSAIKRHGPFSGKLNGKYIVLHPGDRKLASEAFSKIERTYSNLRFGKLKPEEGIGDGGFISTEGEFVSDYTSSIVELRSNLETDGNNLLVSVVLPDEHSSEVYFKSRSSLFERLFGSKPIPTQALSHGSLKDIVYSEKKSYPIRVNLASQMYVKLGGTGTAVWILKQAADAPISGIDPGSTCYAYHDVSRRPKRKASATAYSALTDSYGRYIATGTKPVGGEKLTPSVFYDILVKLLQKTSMFSQKYASLGKNTNFNLRRLVFAKDGVVREDEADMMEEAILEGLPEEKKRPLPKLLEKRPLFPNDLVIDLIGVNKSPNKRVFSRIREQFTNVTRGTSLSYNKNRGLLVSSTTRRGTTKPIEISLKKHLCLNNIHAPNPSISQILEEYYQLTFLNWASIFKQGKYALPQILTQNLGENISAGVFVPDDMILL